MNECFMNRKYQHIRGQLTDGVMFICIFSIQLETPVSILRRSIRVTYGSTHVVVEQTQAKILTPIQQ